MTSGVRTVLHEVLPLQAPYLVQVFPSYACNFKCAYCIHSLPRSEHGFISDKTFMDFELYKSAIDDMSAAGWRLKMLRFAAIGEPLLHPQISDMVAYAVEKQIAATVDIVTNASLLTETLANQLIAAGLSTLRVSLEGISAEDYAENCNVNVDFERIRDSIASYYNHCGNSRIYVKIIDYMLKGDAEREKLFYDTFAPISHSIAVEHLTPTIEGIDINKISGGEELAKTQGGHEMRNINICPQPFYMLQINPDGNLVPCCSMKYPGIFGNASTTGVVNAWNGSALNTFRIAMISGVKHASETCAKCSLYQYGVYAEDILDGHEEELLGRLNALNKII